MANENAANFVYAGENESVEDAEVDWDAVKDLHRAHLIGTYDAALVAKDEKGKPKIVHKTEKPTQRGGWIGAGIGALIGLILPAVFVGGAIGAGVGALVGHLAGGMSRSDLKDIGDMLDEGEAAILVIGEATIERASRMR